MKIRTLSTLAGATGLALAISSFGASAAPLDTARSIVDGKTSVEFAQGGFRADPRAFRGGGGFRGAGGYGYRGGYGRGGWNRGYYGRGYGYGYGRRGWGGYGAGIGLGLATGAIVGGALAAQAAQPPVTYYDQDIATGSVTNEDVAYCQARFKSYDVNSGTYLGYDGQRHACPAQ